MSGKANSGLLKLLFEDSPKDDALASYIEMISEEMEYQADLKSKKSPLSAALKKLGVIVTGLKEDPTVGYVLSLSREDYKEAQTTLETPEGMHALAELGWLATFSGDKDATGEGDCQVNFIEITGDEEPSDEEKKPDLEQSDMDKIAKDSYEFVHDPLPDREDIKASDSTKGVGDAKSGKDPEGTPKGTKKS